MMRRSLTTFVLLTLFGACGDLEEGPGQSNHPFDQVDLRGGKGDMLSSAHIIDDIDLNSSIDGRFTNVRVYGFTFEAKAGSTIQIGATTRAGASSIDVEEGQPLDTVMAMYGPMISDTERGPKIAYSDDDPFGGGSGQLPAVEILADGKYLVLMATWNDPGNGTFNISVGCEGTDFQCRRPVESRPCNPNTRYITGGTIIGTETWNDCKVVLVEHVEVAEDAVLTINPGVTVQGNYVGTGPWGTVDMVVYGTLQAVGTGDDPVVFTALKDGWKGLVLKGSSNTIAHAFVEKAHVGIEAHGSNNTFTDLNVNSCDTGLYFAKTSTVNAVERVKISKVRDGIRLAGAADIIDSVILGNGADTDSGSGIWGDGAVERSRFHRALIANFPHGLYLVSTELEVYDSTIVNNKRGILVLGQNAGVNPPRTCPSFPSGSPISTWRPSPPPSWGRDPIFVRCDIINNTEFGIKITAPELLVVEHSNVRDNGAGILVESDSLHDDSRVTHSNIHRNGASAQVESWHQNGTLDISNNYWAQLSDPELSASWNMSHAKASSQQCSTNQTPNNSCTRVNYSRYTCSSWDCRRQSNGWRCTAGATVASWDSKFVFTGFSPMELDAGPKLDDISQQVQDERQKQGL